MKFETNGSDKENYQPGIYVTQDELSGLQERARHISNGISSQTRNMLQGNRPSKMHGRGGAFDQIRNYLAGDDVRNIDWNVTARMGKPFVRVFNEERDTPVMLLVDQSSNMFFATRKQMKSVVAARIAAYSLWMAFNQKRPSGAVLFGDDSLAIHRPRTNQSNLHGILAQLVSYNQKLSKLSNNENAAYTFADSLRQLNQAVSKDAFVILVSDFQQMDEECWQLVEKLSYRANVIATPIYDGVVDALPSEGNVLARYAEFEAALDFSSRESRKKITSGSQGRIDELDRRFSELGIPVLLFSTFQDVEEQLISGLRIPGSQHG